jgi:hypothetical protein
MGYGLLKNGEVMNIEKIVICALVVVVAGPAVADGGPQHRAKQMPPVKMGTSGGSAADSSNAFCCGGTLGASVCYDGTQHILSNNHVLGRSGSATAGEDDIQPGLIDVSCQKSKANIVGDFAGDLVPLGTANVDAALSKARSGMVSTEILDIGVPSSIIQAAAVGLPVMKSGRTTGFTTGTITSINTSVSIQYQKGCNSGKKFTVFYTDQIVTGAMSAGGDSGSLLVSNNGTPNPVGLLYAGSSSTTIYNPIQHVVNAFTAGEHTFSFGSCSTGTISATTTGASTPTSAQSGAAASYRGPSDADVEFVRGIKENHEPNLFARPGVLGVGVGADDENPEEAVIVVYLETGMGAALPRGFPEELDGVKVKVIPTDKFVAQNSICNK